MLTNTTIIRLWCGRYRCLHHSLCRFLAAAIVVSFVGCGCHEVKYSHSIMPQGVQLHEGDVVLRSGGGIASHAVMMADGNGAYSHVGIVVDSSGVMMIVHAVPDEPDFEGDVDRVKMDSIGRFFSSVNADHGEVLRHKDSIAAKAAARYAMNIYRRHTLFDHDYDEKDTIRMCCTELITFSFLRAGAPLTGVERQNVRVLNVSTDCAFPSDILHCTDFKSVVKF